MTVVKDEAVVTATSLDKVRDSLAPSKVFGLFDLKKRGHNKQTT